MEDCESGAVFEGAVGGVPTVGVYGGAEGGSLQRPEDGEVCDVAGPIGEGAPVMRVRQRLVIC